MINETSRYEALYLEINNRTPEIFYYHASLLTRESTHIQRQIKWDEQSTGLTTIYQLYLLVFCYLCASDAKYKDVFTKNAVLLCANSDFSSWRLLKMTSFSKQLNNSFKLTHLFLTNQHSFSIKSLLIIRFAFVEVAV